MSTDSMKLIYIFIAIILAGCASAENYTSGQPLAWDEAKKFINSNPGKIDSVAQAHSLHVSILLNNGDTLKTKETRIDEIFGVLRQCGNPCKHINWITE